MLMPAPLTQPIACASMPGRSAGSVTARSVSRCGVMIVASRLHVGKSALLSEGQPHHMRGDEANAGIETGNQIRAHLVDRQLSCLGQLLRDESEGNVALPEDRAPCLHRLDADVAAVEEDVANGELAGH